MNTFSALPLSGGTGARGRGMAARGETIEKLPQKTVETSPKGMDQDVEPGGISRPT